MNEVLDFLRRRRSRPAKMLTGPGPGRPEIEEMLAIAGRGARSRQAGALALRRDRGRGARAVVAGNPGERAAVAGADADKGAGAFEGAPLAIAVIGVPRESEKIPEREQALVGGLRGLQPAGRGPRFRLGRELAEQAGRPTTPHFSKRNSGWRGREWIAGFIHIGTCDAVPPELTAAGHGRPDHLA